MYIQSNLNSISMNGTPKPNAEQGAWKSAKQRIKQSILNVLPDAAINDSAKNVKRWKGFDERMSRPAENRLIMGATALVTQPLIDYNNPRVDQETRTVSRNRTIAKILAGTSVGILVRGSCYGLVGKMTDVKGEKSYSKALLPSNVKFLNDITTTPKLLKNYRSALSTGLAILAMCITNFVIDAPLTVMLTNKFNAKSEAKKIEKEAKNG